MFSAHSLPSEIIINIIGDKYGSIFYFTVFGVLLFWLFLGMLLCYKITRVTILVVGRVNDWV